MQFVHHANNRATVLKKSYELLSPFMFKGHALGKTNSVSE